ncbi:MAG: hypothetical protein CMF50_03480 [Legionellales bacterium]|nr:hypothetical protein [Legionellales bacterium]|tara:strand:+ start:4696 stop:5064 length:369 start_codon:yes stop_codon:yes gene_type:complete
MTVGDENIQLPLSYVDTLMPISLFSGCTLQETLIVLIGMWSICFVVSGIVFLTIFHMLWPAFLITNIVALFATYIAVKLLGRIKRDKPAGYTAVMLKLLCQRIGIGNYYVINQQRWGIGREG